MNFVSHLNLQGRHAPFSPSQSSWLRYDDEKAITVFNNMQAKEIGTRLHAWAKETIDLGLKQPRSKKTIYAYVNDAIGFKMSTEVILYYSDYFFGTADAISFRDNFLRIHDLKTGKHEASMEQLIIYAALFCLEYRVKPVELAGCELRIYQNDGVVFYTPEPSEIMEVIDKIVHLNKVLERHNYLEG